jgi:hypothetical protein
MPAGPDLRRVLGTRQKTLLRALKVRAKDLPTVEGVRDEAADCLHRHFVTVTEEEEARRREFDERLAAATGQT